MTASVKESLPDRRLARRRACTFVLALVALLSFLASAVCFLATPEPRPHVHVCVVAQTDSMVKPIVERAMVRPMIGEPNTDHSAGLRAPPGLRRPAASPSAPRMIGVSFPIHAVVQWTPGPAPTLTVRARSLRASRRTLLLRRPTLPGGSSPTPRDLSMGCPRVHTRPSIG